MTRPRIERTSPAGEVHDGFPLGNGRLGAMLYGRPGRDWFDLNADTLWSGGPLPSSPVDGPLPARLLPRLREAVAAGDHHTAEELARLLQSGAYPQSYQPLGRLEWCYASCQEVAGYARSLDLAVGYRVHGVLPAVAQGVPGVLVAYDTRSQELAETLKIPVVPEAALADGGWRAVYQEGPLNALAKSYAQSYDRMKNFLETNGVPHRM